MSEQNKNMEKEKWYTRPIFSVSNMQASLHHYCNLLEFEQGWKYEEDGDLVVTQVNKGDFELILTTNLDRVGQGRIFISLATAEMDKLQRCVDEKQIMHNRVYWGYPAIQIRDSDGNEMLFPLEAEG